MSERSEAEKSVELIIFWQHALVIWKEQKKIHQPAQQINFDIL